MFGSSPTSLIGILAIAAISLAKEDSDENSKHFIDVRKIVQGTLDAMAGTIQSNSTGTPNEIYRLFQLPADIMTEMAAEAGYIEKPETTTNRHRRRRTKRPIYDDTEEDYEDDYKPKKKRKHHNPILLPPNYIPPPVVPAVLGQNNPTVKVPVASGLELPTPPPNVYHPAQMTPIAAYPPQSTAAPVGAAIPQPAVSSPQQYAEPLSAPQYAYQPVIQPDGKTYYQKVLIVPQSDVRYELPPSAFPPPTVSPSPMLPIPPPPPPPPPAALPLPTPAPTPAPTMAPTTAPQTPEPVTLGILAPLPTFPPLPTLPTLPTTTPMTTSTTTIVPETTTEQARLPTRKNFIRKRKIIKHIPLHVPSSEVEESSTSTTTAVAAGSSLRPIPITFSSDLNLFKTTPQVMLDDQPRTTKEPQQLKELKLKPRSHAAKTHQAGHPIESSDVEDLFPDKYYETDAPGVTRTTTPTTTTSTTTASTPPTPKTTPSPKLITLQDVPVDEQKRNNEIFSESYQIKKNNAEKEAQKSSLKIGTEVTISKKAKREREEKKAKEELLEDEESEEEEEESTTQSEKKHIKAESGELSKIQKLYQKSKKLTRRIIQRKQPEEVTEKSPELLPDEGSEEEEPTTTTTTTTQIPKKRRKNKIAKERILEETEDSPFEDVTEAPKKKRNKTRKTTPTVEEQLESDITSSSTRSTTPSTTTTIPAGEQDFVKQMIMAIASDLEENQRRKEREPIRGFRKLSIKPATTPLPLPPPPFPLPTTIEEVEEELEKDADIAPVAVTASPAFRRALASLRAEHDAIHSRHAERLSALREQLERAHGVRNLQVDEEEEETTEEPPRKRRKLSAAKRKRMRYLSRMRKAKEITTTLPVPTTTTTSTTTTTTTTTTAKPPLTDSEEIYDDDEYDEEETTKAPRITKKVKKEEESLQVKKPQCLNIRSFARQFGSPDVAEFVEEHCSFVENYYPELTCDRRQEYLAICQSLY